MKQFYITKENVTPNHPDDCYLAPEDPIQELKIAAMMGGLGAQARLDEYKAKVAEANKVNTGSIDKATYMKDNNIKPGTPAWFELWFGRQGK
jgi:hypothetical protein